MGLREEKKRRVRDAILRACERLFRSRGFDATTIDEIVGQVGISRQTFFNYFAGKEAVLTEIAVEWMRGQSALAQEGAATGARGTLLRGLRRALREQCRLIEQDRDFMRIVFTRSGLFFPHGPQVGQPSDKPRLDRTRQFFDALAGFVRVAQDSGEIRRELDPHQVAEMYLAITVVTIRLWLTGYWPEAGRLEDRLLRAVDALLLGLAPRTAAGETP